MFLIQRQFARAAVLSLVAAVIQMPAGHGQQAAQEESSALTAASGNLRLWGYDGMSSLLQQWEKGFQRSHPAIHFDNKLPGAAAAMAGIYTGTADISVMGRELWPNETMAFQWVYQYPPVGVEVVTSGLASPGQSYSPVVVVNAKNPLSTISLAQLAGIYGNEHRRGGKNLRVWGDLGLTGIWADRPIHIYGYGVNDGLGVYFRKTVLLGDFKPNASEHLVTDRQGGASAASRIRTAVRSDPLAIGYAEYYPGSRQVKTLPVAAEANRAAVMPNSQTISDRSYPLTRSLRFYINRSPGKAVPPDLLAFLHYILSPEGQQIVAADGHFVPLPRKLADAEAEELNQSIPGEKGPGRSDVQNQE